MTLEDSDVVLCDNISLVRGFEIPLHCLNVVLGHIATIAVKSAYSVLSDWMYGLEIPIDGSMVILWDILDMSPKATRVLVSIIGADCLLDQVHRYWCMG